MQQIVRRSPTLRASLALIVIIAIGLVCYWFALSLPLFWDDVFQFIALDRIGFTEIWASPVAGLAYYRPLAFSIWKALRLLQGGYHAPTHHFVNLSLHVLNALLLALVVSRQARARHALTGFAAAFLFLLFPFSVQAVAPINSLMHPLHATFILAAVLTYQLSVTSVQTGRYGLRVISVLLAGAAMFAHENGVLAPALVTLTALCAAQGNTARKPLKQTIIAVLPYWAITFLGYVLSRSLAGAEGSLALGSMLDQLESRAQNGTYFVQALVYPVSWLAKNLNPLLAQPNDLLAILLICIPCILVWTALAWRAGRGMFVAWGLAWFFIAALPACLVLPFNYVLEAPRLVYLSSIGAAIFWAAPVSFVWKTRTANILSMACAGLVVLAAGAWGYVYIQRRADLYTMLGQSITDLYHAMQHDPACAQASRETTLLVNFPDWFFTRQPEYLLGHEGITAISVGSTMDELYRVNFGTEPVFTNAVLPDIQLGDAAYVGMGQSHTYESLQTIMRASSRVIVNTAGGDGAQMRYAGCLRAENQPPSAQYQAQLGERLLLLHAAYAFDADGRGLSITLDWQAQSASAADTTVFAQLLDASGRVVAQSDGYPLAGTSPVRLWRAGDIWREVRHVHAPDALPPGSYRLIVGAYLTEGTRRLPAIDAAGNRLPDDAVEVARP
jgi:hypothetical protein